VGTFNPKLNDDLSWVRAMIRDTDTVSPHLPDETIKGLLDELPKEQAAAYALRMMAVDDTILLGKYTNLDGKVDINAISDYLREMANVWSPD